MSRVDQNMRDGFANLIAAWKAQPPRAAHFIVTIYGDVVVPRGGTLWMGTLIEICDAVGLSETLVRTAVSRLVAARQLIGERSGRRSYYRLTDQAQVDFAAAARVLFSAPSYPTDLIFFVPRDPSDQTPVGFVPVGSELMVGPNRPGQVLPAGLALRAEVGQGAADLPDFAARYWDLERHAAAYQRVLDRFLPLEALLAAGVRPSPRDCLVARLLLVDDFREAILHDPGLPAAALPADWPGHAARVLFARLYLSLSVWADSHVSTTFQDATGLLAASTVQVRARLEGLSRMLAQESDGRNAVIQGG